VDQEPKANSAGSIWKEVTTQGYLERARARAQKRKSPWNLLLIPFFLAGIPSITYALFRIMWIVHTTFYPQHAGQLREFWGSQIGFFAFVSSFLMLVPLLFAAIPLTLMIANSIFWLVRPARRAFEREAGDDESMSFSGAMSQLWAISKWIVPICLLLSLVGAVTLRHLR